MNYFYCRVLVIHFACGAQLPCLIEKPLSDS